MFIESIPFEMNLLRNQDQYFLDRLCLKFIMFHCSHLLCLVSFKNTIRQVFNIEISLKLPYRFIIKLFGMSDEHFSLSSLASIYIY